MSVNTELIGPNHHVVRLIDNMWDCASQTWKAEAPKGSDIQAGDVVELHVLGDLCQVVSNADGVLHVRPWEQNPAGKLYPKMEVTTTGEGPDAQTFGHLRLGNDFLQVDFAKLQWDAKTPCANASLELAATIDPATWPVVVTRKCKRCSAESKASIGLADTVNLSERRRRGE